MEPVTIMLVEDEGLLLFEFEEALTEAGFNVVAFSSGTKAMDYLRSAEGAAKGVVTDIRLPDRAFDGWEVARIAREIDPEVAVVYISVGTARLTGRRRAFQTASCLRSRSPLRS